MNPKVTKTQFNFFYWIFAIWAVFLIHGAWTNYNTVKTVAYNEFQTILREGKVEEVHIRDNTIHAKLKEPIDGKTNIVSARVEADLAQELLKHNVKFTRVIESTWLSTILSWVVPAIVFFALWIFIMKKMAEKGPGGGLMSIGKSKAKVYVEQDTKVTFEDIAGIDEAEDELKELVNFLKDPKSYGRLGAKMPKGVLLVGPPGTGKTLLAKAVAGEAHVPFFSLSGSDFVEMFVGVGAARVRDLFEQARKQAPCIIFIDELDALGKARNQSGFAGGHDEKEQTLNQLLVELDGFDGMQGIVLLGATNRPEVLDPALLRAGRFDRQILVDRPDKKGRIQILKVHLKKIKIENNLDLEKIAALTPGFTGADLANLINEAALLATRRNANEVSFDDFTVAVERLIAGLEKKNRVLNANERKIVAYHEMGHALVAASIPGSDPVHKVSIIPRGIGALGYTIQRPTEDRFLMTKEELENKMAILLGGRAAELLIFNHLSTGASDDLAKTTDIARSIIMRYGMDEDLGHITYESERSGFLGQSIGGARKYSETSAEKIDQKVKDLSSKALENARSVLNRNLDLLKESSEDLLRLETLTELNLQSYFKRIKTLTDGR